MSLKVRFIIDVAEPKIRKSEMIGVDKRRESDNLDENSGHEHSKGKERNLKL